jgi:hypothetical protein
MLISTNPFASSSWIGKFGKRAPGRVFADKGMVTVEKACQYIKLHKLQITQVIKTG